MQFGLVLPTERVASENAEQAWETVEQRARFAEQSGFDSLWVGEHHFMETIYFDNFQALSYLAGVTDRVSLGTSVCLGPLYNPLRLAERVANLDVQTGGRTILGLGLGYRHVEFDVLGIDRTARVPRLLETIEVLQQCWTDGVVTHTGDVFSFETVPVRPTPPQGADLPLWLAGRAPAAVERAARRGEAWLPSPGTPVDELEDRYATYEAARTTEPTTRPLWREVFVARDPDRAIELAKGPLVEKYDAYASDHDDTGRSGADSIDDRFDRYRAGRFLVGTPGSVADEIEAYRDLFRNDHLLVRSQWPGMPDDVAAESLELFADEVMPMIS